MKYAIIEKDRPTERGDELALENQYVSGHAKESKKSAQAL